MTEYFEPEPGVRLAYAHAPGAEPTVVFLPGFNSAMSGGKARYLEAWSRASGNACLRFDYRGHGQSSGRLEEGSIGQWYRDASAVIEHLAPGELLLVGASMGGWVMLLLARALGSRVRGLVGVAAAADFTERAVSALDPRERLRFEADGITWRPSRYGDGPYPLTARMLEEGKAHRVLDGGWRLPCPLHLLHGVEDPDLPWPTALEMVEALEGDELLVTLVKGGDHRLSRARDLALIGASVARQHAALR